MRKRLRMLVQASMACMLALSSVALPTQVRAASETQIVSDISIGGLRDVKNLERGAQTYVFISTYPEEGAELSARCDDESIAKISLEGNALQIQGVAEGTCEVTVTAMMNGKIEQESFSVQVIAPLYEESAHEEVNINESDWRFRLEQDMSAAPAEHTVPVVDDSWDHVQVPHCWNSKDGADGGNDYIRGKGWYITDIDLSDARYQDKELYLEVQGACKITDVYVNGEYVGTHEGGWSTFRFDISAYVNDGVNQIALCVDNRVNSLMPLSGDFTVFGGLYRDVNLIAVDDTHFDLNDHGSEGVLISQTGISDVTRTSTPEEVFADGGKISIDASIVLNAEDTAYMQAFVYDDQWNEVSAGERVRIEGSEDVVSIDQTLSVADPHLWDGVDDPYLYNVKVYLYDAEGSIKDVVYKKIGFRFYYVDEDEGFFLNGRSYPLRGVAKHQDRQGKGYALSKKDQEEDMAMIDAIGANAVRFAHYQHDEYAYELADIYGICAWAEIPLVNGMTDSDHFRESTKNNMEELIKQNISHPSIVVWGTHNEQWPNNGGRINTLLRDLYDLAHALDDSRLVTVATAQSQSAALSWQSDVSAWNKYFGLYEAQDVRYFGTWLDQVKEYAETHESIDVTDESTGETITVPISGKIGMSEYGVGSNVEYHEEDPGYRVGTSFDAYQSEEFQAQWHEIYYEAIDERPWLWGTFVWNMFEFGSDSRSEAGRTGVNNKGMVSYDRTLKKDVYYFYQANWSDEPTLHINSKRFENRYQDGITAKIYANMDSVELIVNGESQGVLNAEDVELHKFTWDITLRQGDNHVIAIGTKDGKTYTDEVTWNRSLYDTVSVTSDVYNFSYVSDDNSTVSGIPGGTDVAEFMDNVSSDQGSVITVWSEDKSTQLGAQDVIVQGMWVKAVSEDGSQIVWYQVIAQPISQHKPVSADNPGSSQPIANMVDGDIDAAWNSNVTLASESPQYAVIDLQDEYYVYDTNILWWDHDQSHRTFNYSISVSLDQEHWTTVVGPTQSSSQAQGTAWSNRSFDPVLARYVRIEGLSATTSAATMYIREAEVHGFRLDSDTLYVDSTSVRGWSGMSADELLVALYAEGNYDDICLIDAQGQQVSGDAAVTSDMQVCVRANDAQADYRLEKSGLYDTPISQDREVTAFDAVDKDGLTKPNEDVLEGETEADHGSNYAPAYYINDGDMTTRWSGAMDASHMHAIFPAKVCIDLGDSYQLNHLDLTFYNGSTPFNENNANRYYSYRIYAADDLDVLQQENIDEQYLIVDGSDNFTAKESRVQRDLQAQGRYILLVVEDRSTNTSYHAPSVWEMTVEGYHIASDDLDVDVQEHVISNIPLGMSVSEFLDALQLDGNGSVTLQADGETLSDEDVLYEGAQLRISALHGESEDVYALSFADDADTPISQGKRVHALNTSETVDGQIVANEDAAMGHVAENINDGSVDTRWSGVMNAARTQSYYPASVQIQLTDEADTDDWYYLTGVSIDWFNSASKRSYQYELHALNPVGIAGGYDLDARDNTAQDHTEHWTSGKSAQIKDMTITVTGTSLTQAYIPAVVKELQVYGWRLKGSVVEESSASVRLDGPVSVAKLIAMVQPRGNCTVEIRDAQGSVRSASDEVSATDRLVVTDVRGQEFTYTLNMPSQGADKSALNALIEQAGTLNEEEYTAESWNRMQGALDAAKAVYANEQADQEMVDQAAAQLQQAIDELERADDPASSDAAIQALKDMVDKAIALDSDDEVLNAAIDAAQAVLAKEAPTSKEVVIALLDLSEAMQALNTGASEAALRQDLEAAITFINEHILNDVEGLRPAKVQALRDAITAAQDVLANEDATADQLKQASRALTKAAQELWEIVSKAELNALIEAANGYLDGEYTEESLEALQAAIETAQAVADNEDAATAEVSEAIVNLADAIAALQPRQTLDVSALEAEIELIQQMVDHLDQYVPSTVNGLQDKLTAAKAIAQAPQSQEEIDEQTAILREARLSARTLADKEALIAAIHNASLLNLNLYTADSAAAVRELLAQAEAMLDDQEVTQADVDTLTASLDRAVSRLEIRLQSDMTSDKPQADLDEAAASTAPSSSSESDTAASTDHLGWMGLILACATVLFCIRRRSIR